MFYYIIILFPLYYFLCFTRTELLGFCLFLPGEADGGLWCYYVSRRQNGKHSSYCVHYNVPSCFRYTPAGVGPAGGGGAWTFEVAALDRADVGVTKSGLARGLVDNVDVHLDGSKARRLAAADADAALAELHDELTQAL